MKKNPPQINELDVWMGFSDAKSDVSIGSSKKKFRYFLILETLKDPSIVLVSVGTLTAKSKITQTFKIGKRDVIFNFTDTHFIKSKNLIKYVGDIKRDNLSEEIKNFRSKALRFLNQINERKTLERLLKNNYFDNLDPIEKEKWILILQFSEIERMNRVGIKLSAWNFNILGENEKTLYRNQLNFEENIILKNANQKLTK